MRNSKKLNVALWILQGFLALFLAGASGAPKLFLPLDMIPLAIPLSQSFLWFIGTMEVLGALGLILPGVTHVRPGLTPLAALGIVLLTICAAIYHLMANEVGSALFALGVGVLAAIVGYYRWQVIPHREAEKTATLRTA